MSVFKCKMCGGSLEIIAGTTVVQCEYCGTKQTLPRLSDERIENLYDRANHFRRNNDYDKALNIYEQILSEDRSDSEAYWSIVLCKYGIEYVEDPATRRRIPTINRTQYASIFSDEDYKSAILYADDSQKEIYEQEAKEIDNIQKGILEVSRVESPFDVFICYKETDANGRRTVDSVLATDLYKELTREGYKVFFSRITLEDKLGQEYEPYIFAALNSARVMVVLGTRLEHFNSVWVKNEWSRFLALIKNGAKKTLIPAYRDMDPYDLPEEFLHLQAQDMSKLGFMQDLTHGIKKILSNESNAEKRNASNTSSTSVETTIDYALLLIEDGNILKAEQLLDKAASTAPKHPMIYVGKLLIELGVKRQEDLAHFEGELESSTNYQKAIRFAPPQLKAALEDYALKAKTNNVKSTYLQAVETMNSAFTVENFITAKQLFDMIPQYADAKQLSALCSEKAIDAKKKSKYQNAIKLMSSNASNRIEDLQKSITIFNSIVDYKDSRDKIDQCERLICSEKEKLAKKKKKIQKIIISAFVAVLVIIIAIIICFATGLIHIHEYNITESRKATCEASGYEIKKCDICNESIRVEHKALGHKYSDATCTAPKKCQTCGQTSGSALGHTTDGTKCSRCGITTFETITYSGTGSSVKNLNLPKGEYRVTCTMTSGNGNMTIYLNYGANHSGYLDEEMIFNDYDAGASEVTVVKGPIDNGSLVINADSSYWGSSGWKITIEAIG